MSTMKEDVEALLRSLVEHEDDACSIDHNGFCQTHYHEAPCSVRRARIYLGLPDAGLTEDSHEDAPPKDRA